MNKTTRSNLDEMQEQKLLQIEHNSCWLFFWILVATILIQILLGNVGLEALGGECVVLFIGGLYLCFSCVKNGIWDRKLKASPKTNLLMSLVAGLLMGGIWGVRSYLSYHALIGSIATFVFMTLSVFALCIVTLTALTCLYESRRKKLDNEEEEPKS